MNDGALLADMAEMGPRALLNEPGEHGELPLERVAHIIRAGVETYLIFSARSRPPILATPMGGLAGPNGQQGGISRGR